MIKLTPKAFAVLRYLVEHAGRLVTKDEIFEAVWKETVVSDITLAVCVREIRRSLGDEAKTPQYIETVHRRGYRFIGEVVSSQQSVASREEQSTNGQEIDAVMPAKAGIQEPQAEASSESLWIPAPGSGSGTSSVGMTHPTSTPQNHNPSLQLDQALDPEPWPFEASALAVQRSWSVRSLVIMSLVLLVGTILTVQYLSLPTSSTQSLIPNPQSLPLPDKPSIIVLPLVNLSGDPEQEYFSDGLTEVLTGDLSRISSLFVIARNSAFTYKGKAVKVQDVSKEMGVRYVLEGSVQKAEQRVRINVQLIDATTGYHLWSQQYDHPLQDIFALQDEIVQKIVTTLKLQLSLQEQGIIVRKHTDNTEANDYYLHGLEYAFRYTKETNAQARQMFEKAIDLDPQYAEAYAWLGRTYLFEWAWRWSTDPQNVERAFELVQKAIALDDSLPGAHSRLGQVYALKQQYDQALSEGERAIALDPNNADSYALQAEVLLLVGRPEEALQMVEQAVRLNPRSPPWYLVELGVAYQLTGRYAESIATLKEATNRSPNFLPAHQNLALSYVQQWISQQSSPGQTLEPAVAAVQRALTLNDSHYWSHMLLGLIYLYQQQYDQALVEMKRAVALSPNDALNYAVLAEMLSCVGRSEEALEAAAQALRLKPLIPDGHLANVGIAYAVAGRYEEAQAPLQRFLSRYNWLPVHLTLAAVYSELGRDAEAHAEMVEVLRLNPKFSLEVHKQRMPIKDPIVLERQIAALRKAGLK
jgi:TolB-like protein/DNA-binding winged helix-turn-helix (wHTH) protein/Flp pilus assembly protein TadD